MNADNAVCDCPLGLELLWRCIYQPRNEVVWLSIPIRSVLLLLLQTLFDKRTNVFSSLPHGAFKWREKWANYAAADLSIVNMWIE